VNQVWRILKGTAKRFHSARLPLLAAAIAYYALFAFVPLVALLVAGAGMILGSPAAEQRAVDHVMAVLPLEPSREQNLVSGAIHSLVRQSRTMTALGVIGLLGFSFGAVGALRGALDAAWGIVHRSRFVHRRIVDVGLLLGFSLMLLVSVAATAAPRLLIRIGAGWVLDNPTLSSLMWVTTGTFVPAVLSFLAFLLLYRFVPQTRHGFRDVWPTALLTAGLFELAKHVFTQYVTGPHRYQAVYGALGAVLAFLAWTYVSSLIMLVGAAFGAEYEKVARRIG